MGTAAQRDRLFQFAQQCQANDTCDKSHHVSLPVRSAFHFLAIESLLAKHQSNLHFKRIIYADFLDHMQEIASTHEK